MVKGFFNLPNIITLIRLILVPLIAYFILRGNTNIAVTLFVAAALSDKLDGEVARKLKRTTPSGAIFDAVTDSILILTTIFFTYLTGHVTALILLLLFLPKVITFFILLFVYKLKFVTTMFSKWSSVIFYILIPLFLLDIEQIVVYILIFVIYALSLIHWIKLIKLKLNK